MKSYHHYITGSMTFGISAGMISLLARWALPNFILFSPIFLMRYGLIAGIVFSLATTLGMFFFSMLVNRIRSTYPDFETLGDLFKSRLANDGYWIMSFSTLFLGLNSIFIKIVGASIFFNLLFDIPYIFSLFFFLLYCFVVVSLGGMYWIQKFEALSLFFIFLALILTPIYFYIQDGIYPIYSGIRLLHPYLLYINSKELMFFLFTALVIGFGQVLVDQSTWQKLYLIEKEKVRTTFYLTSLIWPTVPLAISGMILIAIYNEKIIENSSVIFQLLTKIEPIALSISFLLFCFFIIAIAIKTELHATTVHFVKHIRKPFKNNYSDRNMYRDSYLFSAISLLILLIITYLFKFDFIKLLFFLGSLYASIIPIMLSIIIGKRKVSRLIPYTIFIGLGAGILSLLGFNPIPIILSSFAISVVFVLLVNLFSPKEK